MRRSLKSAGLVGVVGVLLWAGAASAIYTPNPAGRWAAHHFFLAGDFEYNADKDTDFGEVDDMVGLFVRPAYSVAQNIMIYGRFGFRDSHRTDAGFAGGFGVQGAYVFPRAPEWAVGGAFDFLYWNADDNTNRNIEWKEFQVTPAVSYNIPQVPQLTPYAGVMFDFVDARRGDQDDPVGFLIGTNFDPTNRFRLDAQFRAISETGFYFSAGYLF